jgi:hypothetical protein
VRGFASPGTSTLNSVFMVWLLTCRRCDGGVFTGATRNKFDEAARDSPGPRMQDCGYPSYQILSKTATERLERWSHI